MGQDIKHTELYQGISFLLQLSLRVVRLEIYENSRCYAFLRCGKKLRLCLHSVLMTTRLASSDVFWIALRSGKIVLKAALKYQRLPTVCSYQNARSATVLLVKLEKLLNDSRWTVYSITDILRHELNALLFFRNDLGRSLFCQRRNGTTSAFPLRGYSSFALFLHKQRYERTNGQEMLGLKVF